MLWSTKASIDLSFAWNLSWGLLAYPVMIDTEIFAHNATSDGTGDSTPAIKLHVH